MALPALKIFRHDRGKRSLVTLAGDIDPATAPLVRDALEGCLRDGITTVDVDLTVLGDCDLSGVDVFLDASRRATAAQATVRLHHPPPQTARLLALTGAAPLLLGPPRAPVPPSLLRDLHAAAPSRSPR